MNVTPFEGVTAVSQTLPEDDRFKSKLTPVGDYISAAYMLLVGLLAVVLNSAVLAVGWRKRRQLKPPEWYILLLAITDIGISALGYPLIITAAVYHKWLGGDAACTLYGWTGFFFSLASITCLAVMSVVRYLKTCRMHTLGGRVNETFCLVSIIFILMYAAFWSSLPLMGWGEYGLEPHHISCGIDWRSPTNQPFIISCMIFCVLLPIVVMVFSYSAITYRLFTGGQQPMMIQQRKHASHMTKMTVLMCAGFLSAWLPYAITSIVDMAGIGLDKQLTVIPVMLAKSSAVYNPVIYFLMVERFRNDVISMLRQTRLARLFPKCSSLDTPPEVNMPPKDPPTMTSGSGYFVKFSPRAPLAENQTTSQHRLLSELIGEKTPRDEVHTPCESDVTSFTDTEKCNGSGGTDSNHPTGTIIVDEGAKIRDLPL